MDRYRMIDKHNDDETWSEMKKDPNGEWVKYKNMKQLRERIEAEIKEISDLITHTEKGVQTPAIVEVRISSTHKKYALKWVLEQMEEL